MEMTFEQWKAAKKDMRRRLSVPGWALLIYYAIMNVAVMGWVILEAIFRLIQNLAAHSYRDIESAIMASSESAWGYFLAAAVGLLVLLLWKKPRFFKEEIFAKGTPMKAGSFFILLCVFISGQMIFQLGCSLLEMLLNGFGYTIMEGIESLQTDPNNFSMFLYAGILAPITEEILFRGLIQRTMLPFGKRFAIIVSSFTFGLFHGNLIQAPYAFAVGLVLGYVAAEYNIVWAMVLHMINNLLLGDLMYRVLGSLPEDVANLIVFGIILVFTVMAVIFLIVKRKEIAAWLQNNRLVGAYVGCYFSCAGTIVLMIVLGLNTIFTTFLLVTPL